ncbi:uncharacterized protein LOC144620552 [Crassostrea virginica]
MIASIVLITNTTHILDAPHCNLKKALDYLDLKYTVQPCKYNDIKAISNELFKLGKGVLSWNFIVFIGTLVLYFGPSFKDFPKIIYIYFAIIAVVAFVLFIPCVVKYNKVVKATEETTDINYSQIESAMLFGLEKNYKSDDMNNTDEMSDRWNTFFIQYDCCAVREVQGPINDFGSTPWCKTSDSCQKANSQIPKTCCKDVTKNDYQNAPPSCYASLKIGTYKPSCSSRMKKLSSGNINEYHLLIVSFSLLTIAVLQIFETIMIVALMFSRHVLEDVKEQKKSCM